MVTFTPTRSPRAHQIAALAKAAKRPSFFYMMDMGTGKSKVALDEAMELYCEGKINRILIVAGKGSYADWINKHIPENVPADIPVVPHLWRGGSLEKERRNLNAIMATSDILPVLVMNIEALGASKTAKTVANNFVGVRTLIIVDESSKIRNIDAQRTKEMIKLGQRAAYRRALTGLAVPKNPLDLWGQFAFLGLERILGNSYFGFRARYCVLKPIFVAGSRTVQVVDGFRDLDKLQERIEPHVFRVLKSDCLDLPPKIFERVHVPLTDEQHRIYDDLKKKATSEIESGVHMTTSNALARLTAMQRVVLGIARDEAGNLHCLDSNRTEILIDVLNEMNGKVVIWCVYRHDIVVISGALEKAFPDRRVVTFYGETSLNDREAAVNAFQFGDADYFVATTATGAFGLTLIAASNVIFYSNAWDLELRAQAEDRVHRDGQERSILYVDFICPGTIDEKILSVLEQKKSVAEMVQGDKLKEWFT